MSVRRLFAVTAAALLGAVVLATPAAAQSAEVGAYTLTTARFWATVAALVGLAGAVVGGVARVRARRRTGNLGRNGALVALGAGVVAVVGGVVNLLVADGGPGTGNGVVGGGVAVVLGLVAAAFGWLVVSRSRHTV